MQVRSFPLFPVLMSYGTNDKFEEVKDSLLSEVESVREEDTNGVNITNVGGWQSKDDIRVKTPQISKYVKQCINESLSESRSPNFDLKYSILNMWINVNGPGDSNSLHNHPGSDFSGIFWLKAPENSGKVYFNNPHDFTQNADIQTVREEYKDALNIHPSYFCTPEEGSFLVFPSSLMHKVDQNKSKENRISVACNIRIMV